MQYSIVTYKKVLQSNSDLRIDGEYFKPAYLTSENLIGNIKSTALGNLAEVKGGKRLPLGETFSEEGIPYIRAEDIRLFTDFAESPKISLELHKKLKNYQTKYNDVLLTIVGNSISDVGIVKFKLDKCNLTENCAKITNLRGLMPEFLFAFLLSRYGQNQIHREKVGTAQPKLALTRIRNFKIALLSESFQSITRNLINKAENAQNKAKQFYHQAEQIILSELGLQDWKSTHQLSFIRNFSDTQSADRIDADYFQPVYDEMLEAVKSAKSYARLGNIVTIKKCVEPGGEAYQDTGIPFVRVSNLAKSGINDNNQQFISESLYESLKMHQPKKGEILLSKDATPGIAYYLSDVPSKMIPSSGILRLTVIGADKIIPEYLTLVLNSVIVQKQIERDVGGSVINHWLVDQVKNTIIPLLDDSVQKEISGKITESFMKREQSRNLLEIAKSGVEMAIEKSEEEALKWISQEVKAYA